MFTVNNIITQQPPPSPSLTFICLFTFTVLHKWERVYLLVVLFFSALWSVYYCAHKLKSTNQREATLSCGVGVSCKDPGNRALLLSCLISADMSGDGSGDFGRERGSGEGEGGVDGTMVDDEDFVSPKLRRK